MMGKKTPETLIFIVLMVYSIIQLMVYNGKLQIHLVAERYHVPGRLNLTGGPMRNITEPVLLEQPTTSVPLLGWRKTVSWKPGSKLDIYDYLINPVDKCKAGKDNITLLVLIKSAPGNGHLRDAARQTHIRGAAEEKLSARMVFIIGESEAQGVTENIHKESETHGDILRVGFHDNYYNLTIKLIMGFKWVLEFCSNTEFLLTTDDDVIVDVPTLVKDLDALPPKDRSRFVLGKRADGYKPWRNYTGVWDKWYVPKEFYSNETYPTFPLGHGYVLSHDVVEKLVQVSRETPTRIPFDDVYCGILLDKLAIGILHRPQWFRRHHPKSRERDYLRIEVPAKEMKNAWNSFRINHRQ
ncbi:beta-1,3-galactosyltransferase 5-like [Lytechinus pictus]|uniref:beta-1,3-galactosyltransferase 5-like n=1 Tax=Lytechinus pictus TaxID=7653 RepID=UPI0030BA0C2C